VTHLQPVDLALEQPAASRLAPAAAAAAAALALQPSGPAQNLQAGPER
jgi:hypothetical protein